MRGCGTPLLPPMKIVMAQTSAGSTLRTKPPWSTGSGGTLEGADGLGGGKLGPMGEESTTRRLRSVEGRRLFELAAARFGQPDQEQHERERGENDTAAEHGAPAAIARELAEHERGGDVADAAEQVVRPDESIPAELGRKELGRHGVEQR